jgi:hypothetical protein
MTCPEPLPGQSARSRSAGSRSGIGRSAFSRPLYASPRPGPTRFVTCPTWANLGPSRVAIRIRSLPKNDEARSSCLRPWLDGTVRSCGVPRSIHPTTHAIDSPPNYCSRRSHSDKLAPPCDAHHANSPLRSHAIQRSGRATSGYGSRRVPRNWWTAMEQPG